MDKWEHFSSDNKRTFLHMPKLLNIVESIPRESNRNWIIKSILISTIMHPNFSTKQNGISMYKSTSQKQPTIKILYKNQVVLKSIFAGRFIKKLLQNITSSK